jgi:hypothetical protein
VVQAVRAYLRGGDSSSLRAALVPPLDWISVERTADRHSIVPLIAYVLRQYGGNMIPREVLEYFQQQWRLNAQKNLPRLQEWCRVLQAFDAAGIAVISFKGPAFALQAYGNVALREFVDIDLLVRACDMPKARTVLVEAGYQLRSPLAGNTDAGLLRSNNRQLDFGNDERGTLIDLHWGALHGMFSFQLPVDQLFESAQVEDHEGVTFLGLSPEHLLLYLCAHGTKHCWLSLHWLCDVVCHVQTARNLNWESCIHSAERTNCVLVLKHSLLLAEEALGLQLPPAIRNYCGDVESRALSHAASTHLFREDGDLTYGSALRYHLAFAKSWHDRFHLLFERVFVPAEPEWRQMQLPRSLSFLYFPIRPLRFMWERLKTTPKSRV